jgi:integrase
VGWDRATAGEVRDLVLWLGRVSKPRRALRTASASRVGTINPVTGKRHLDDGYQPRTVRYNNAVLRSFYEFWLECGEGPVINPVRPGRAGTRRPHAHHSPLQPYRAESRIRYNPKVPRQRPREIPDGRWKDLFGSLTSNRDRAILAMAVSNGARASELLGLRGVDLDWGDQLVRVVRKGTRAEQWLPASGESFVWARLYLADLTVPLDPDGPLWWTLRPRQRNGVRARQVLSYEAARPCRCCRSCRPRATRSGSCSSARSWPAFSPPSSPGFAPPTAAPSR